MIVDNVEKSDKRKLKMKYIPMCFRGEISIKQAAEKIGIKYNSVWRLKKRFSQHGENIFTHGNTGRKPKNTRNDDGEIFDFYKKHFEGSPFMVARDYYCKVKTAVSYSKVYSVLTSHNILSPRARVPKAEKKKHLQRKEREYEGELLQIDGCKHRWFIGKGKTTIHGAVDDATHKITALYMAENECRLGYNELLRRTAEKCGGVPQAIYSDRSACFFTTKTAGVSIEEQLSGLEKSPTQWQTLAKQSHIELIAATSPEAKGRVERMWQTLQGRLPYIFRFYGIDTIGKANEFLLKYIDEYNKRFAIQAQKPGTKYHAEKLTDYDFAVRELKKTKADGTFIYHSHVFRLDAPRSCRVRFELCLSERRGLWAVMDGKEYGVSLCEQIANVRGGAMPFVEQDLISRYFTADTHDSCAKIRQDNPLPPISKKLS